MNKTGDMLRVDTSLPAGNGKRAIGTFIPWQNADGTENAVISAVLKGETFRGRALVLNEYYETAYEPIWDAAKKQVLGMLFVGTSMTDINKDLHDVVTNITTGKSGYVYVIDSKGTYIISAKGLRDGESIWEAKDNSGRHVIQAIVEKARKMSGGSLTNEVYGWKNGDDTVARQKFAAFTYFAPWDWIIAASSYEDDAQLIIDQVSRTTRDAFKWVVLVALGIGLTSLAASYYLSLGISRPVVQIASFMNGGIEQAAEAANQVSTASQSLAQSASEQAASLEETSSSLEEMTSMTKRNSENALRTNELAKQARQAADKGVADMRTMIAAMEAIKASSDDIAKIIKTIDEIAFQTNILALNAAVEAARAGEAGTGFAVVADEVRNLAQRSAKAAKETTAKIQGAMSKTSQGVGISREVAETLNEIVTKARQVDELATEVANASREQTEGIAQINTAVSQMDRVTQSTAASAEESAAAAEELNAQTETMKRSAAKLLEMVGGSTETKPAARAPRAGDGRMLPEVRTHSSAAQANGHPIGHGVAWSHSARQGEEPTKGAITSRFHLEEQ
jgi:hypothetical protein